MKQQKLESTYHKNPEETRGDNFSKALNERKQSVGEFATELGIQVTIYKGVLNGISLFIVNIADEDDVKGVTFKFADILSEEGKEKKALESHLKNRFGFCRNDYKKLQKLIEDLKRNHSFEKIDEATTRFFLNIDSESVKDVAIVDVQVEKYFEEILEYIRENLELFPSRDLSTNLGKDEGYVHGISKGVYIADEKGIEKYGTEVIAIAPNCVQTILSLSNTTEFGNTINQFVQKGYILEGQPQVKLRYLEDAKRMYLIPVSVKGGVLRRD